MYSYADHAAHHSHGGMLMRRDIHRLFDLGQLAVHPDTKTIDVASSITRFGEYGRLHGAPLLVALSSGHVRWLREHWKTHRS
ncbi:HNH endonuclease [Streptosporangium sp. NPDC002607]